MPFKMRQIHPRATNQTAGSRFNVLDLLPAFATPTLVVHCRDDAVVPFEQGQLTASRIPQAKFVALEGRNHILLPRDPAWASFLSEVRQFLHEGGRTTAPLQHPGVASLEHCLRTDLSSTVTRFG
jgi:pimeloyl-ACP methyl ester carboxylesterase